MHQPLYDYLWHNIFVDMLYHDMMVFIDENLVYDVWEKHMDRLEEVLHHMKKHCIGILANLELCTHTI